MKKQWSKQIVLGVFMLNSISWTAALAEAGPSEALDATYSLTSPTGSGTVRMISDGKGHLRTETEVAGTKVISISDFPKHTVYNLVESPKIAMQSTIHDDHQGVVDEASAERLHAKPIGTKTIDGHPCHGFEHASADGKTEAWIGDDIHYLVFSDNTSTKGKTVMSLKSFDKKEPAADMFVVPKEYNLIGGGSSSPTATK